MVESNASTAFSRFSTSCRTQKVKEPLVRGGPFPYEIWSGRDKINAYKIAEDINIIIITVWGCVFYEPGSSPSSTNYSSFNSHKHLVCALSQETKSIIIPRSQKKKMESERVYVACPRSHIWSTKAGIQTQSLHQAAKTDDSSGGGGSYRGGITSPGYQLWLCLRQTPPLSGPLCPHM